MKTRHVLLILLGLLVLAALGVGAFALTLRSAAMPFASLVPEVAYYEPGKVGVEAPGAFAPPAAPAEARADFSTGQDRLVIQTSSLTLVVTDPVESTTSIRKLAESMGGFVVSSNIYQSSVGVAELKVNYASITIRVPSEQLVEALERIKEDSIEVRNETLSGEDVTSQYVDLESRLRNLEAAERQLNRIMDTAEKTEDVLAVYNELVRVRGEIEMVRGQMKFFEESAALSSITVELIPDEAAQPIDIGGWRPEGTAKDAVEALVRTLQWLADAGIWLVICVLPIALLFGLPGFFVVRSVRRRRAGSKERAQS